MLVSIIVVTYNSSKYVTETLDSVYAQSYNDIELIISDDCSSDKTLDICREWCSNHEERFANIKIVKTPHNRGICGNYNYALQFAQGEWIKYIAGDDVLYPHCCSSCLAAVEESGCKIYFGSVTPFSMKDGAVIKWQTRSAGRKCFQTTDPEEQLQRMLSIGAGAVEGPTLFVNRQLLGNLGGVDERYPMCEDLPLALNFAYHGYSIGYIDTPLVMYREYPESVSKSHTRFGSMVNCAVNDYRQKLALKNCDYAAWWHAYVFSGIERNKMHRNCFLLCLFNALKFTDIYILRDKCRNYL